MRSPRPSRPAAPDRKPRLLQIAQRLSGCVLARERSGRADGEPRFYTEREGWCWFFGAIDHHTDELLGWHVAKRGDRWAALEPIRQGVRQAFGGFAKDVARGLAIRCDWGPLYIADAWINEVRWLGITISPSYVGEPECNGVIERFNRTLKEQCVYLQRFESLEQTPAIIAAFIERYNHQWLIERLGHRTPAQARADALGRAA